MITSSTAHSFVEIIAGHEGTNDKIYLLEEFIEDPFFRKIVVYTYDPFKKYYIQKIPEYDLLGNEEFDETTFKLLDDLAKRNLTGHAALAAVSDELSRLNIESADLLKRIIKKDLRWGLAAKNINKASPKLIETFPYMRCSLPEGINLYRWNWNKGVYSQEKMDGLFVNVTIKGRQIFLNTRTGQALDVSHFRVLDQIKSFNGQFHGELLVSKNNNILSRKESNGIINSILKGGSFKENEKPIFYFWDFVEIDILKRKDKYSIRFSKMANLLFYGFQDIYIVETKRVHSYQEALLHAEELINKGLEGTIIKNPDGLWKDGTSKDCVKLKSEKECDLKIIDIFEGQGKYEGTMGAIQCADFFEEVVVRVSGFTDEERNMVWNNKNNYLGKIVSIKYNDIITDKNNKKSLFLPRFVEFRFDKNVADVF